jgi:hypothetical protein
MGIDLLFLTTVAVWLILFTYLLLLHLGQRRLARATALMYQSLEDLREKRVL